MLSAVCVYVYVGLFVRACLRAYVRVFFLMSHLPRCLPGLPMKGRQPYPSKRTTKHLVKNSDVTH